MKVMGECGKVCEDEGMLYESDVKVCKCDGGMV